MEITMTLTDIMQMLLERMDRLEQKLDILIAEVRAQRPEANK